MTALSRREWLQVAALGAAGLGIGVLIRYNATPGRDVSGNSTVRALLADARGPSEGPDGADVRMIAFTDYLCPACRAAAPELAAALGENPGVRVAYRDWPIFGELSERLARLALAADYQGIYPAVHYALMREPPSADPRLQRLMIERAGGDWALIERDLAERGGAIEAALENNRRDAFSLGLAGTPTFLVGDRLIEGALNRSQFARAFAAARTLRRDGL